jgi:hypothetical protein
MENSTPGEHLPYKDSKPIGAGDFYFAINATFRFIERRLGTEGLRRYWTELGRDYYRPVTKNWRQKGLPAVAGYWRAFFGAEPGASVEVTESVDRVVIDVRSCPAIEHLRRARRKIVPDFCQHCYFKGEEMASRAGMAYRLEGGSGSCRHIVHRNREGISDQDLSIIKEVQ